MDWHYELGADSGTAEFSYDVTNDDDLAIVGATAVDLTFAVDTGTASDITNAGDVLALCGNSEYLLGDNLPSLI